MKQFYLQIVLEEAEKMLKRVNKEANSVSSFILRLTHSSLSRMLSWLNFSTTSNLSTVLADGLQSNHCRLWCDKTEKFSLHLNKGLCIGRKEER